MNTTDLVDVASWLAARQSPFGHELPLARELVEWGSDRWPELTFTLDEFGDRANVLVTAANADVPTLAFYAHLDTTLRGDDGDAPVTGDRRSVPSATVDGDVLVGLGLSVAKAPTAAALVALAAAARTLRASDTPFALSMLLVAGGTHRLPPGTWRSDAGRFGVGVERALASGFRPAAVVNVKGGAPAPLRSEPGAAYLRVEVTAPWEPALFRSDDPGLMRAVGLVLAAVESWRSEIRSRPIEQPAPGAASVGREVALGAVQIGDLEKPDLVPGLLEAHVFVVLAPGDDPDALADELAQRIRSMVEVVVPTATVAVGVLVSAAAWSTAGDERVVALVDAAWRTRWGAPPFVNDWRGSTDSVVLRAAGIPTVRVGPVIGRDPDDLRLDRVDLVALTAFSRLYAEVAVRWAHQQVLEENDS